MTDVSGGIDGGEGALLSRRIDAGSCSEGFGESIAAEGCAESSDVALGGAVILLFCRFPAMVGVLLRLLFVSSLGCVSVIF